MAGKDEPEGKPFVNKSVRHFNAKPLPCGAERIKGVLVSGDKEQVTCKACLAAK